MKTEFTPIAMRCTKEQFEAIEPKLKKHGIKKGDIIFSLNSYPYLTNFYSREENSLGSTTMELHKSENTKWLETWDEATFLKACGIEVDTTPTLEEVKEYFKNAKEVKNKYDNTVFLVSEIINGNTPNTFMNKNTCDTVWSEQKGFAEIISYKDTYKDTYTVSKDFILEAHESACSTWKTKIENQFPELFPKVKLEVGKWYKRIGELLVWNGGENTYGFCDGGGYCDNMLFTIATSAIPSTKEEVETALIAEAKRRGFKDGVKVARSGINGDLKFATLELKGFRYHEETNELDSANTEGYYFRNGKWAEIISEPIELSLDEIAKKFGVDVSQIKIKK
jgi:hypothetical protein